MARPGHGLPATYDYSRFHSIAAVKLRLKPPRGWGRSQDRRPSAEVPSSDSLAGGADDAQRCRSYRSPRVARSPLPRPAVICMPTSPSSRPQAASAISCATIAVHPIPSPALFTPTHERFVRAVEQYASDHAVALADWTTASSSEEPTDRRVRDPVPLRPQRGHQVAETARRPQQGQCPPDPYVIASAATNNRRFRSLKLSLTFSYRSRTFHSAAARWARVIPSRDLFSLKSQSIYSSMIP